MAIRLEECNTLVRGNFNPYVVTPEWLARHQICKGGEAEVAMGALTRGLRFRAGNVEWMVDSDGLIVSSVTEDCGRLARDVLRLLPHTPVRAVGSNFTLLGREEDWAGAPLPRLGDKGPGDFPADRRPAQVRWSGIIPREKMRVEITVTFGDDGGAVQFNFHRPVPDAEAAAAAAEQFLSDKQEAKGLLKEFLNLEVGS